jgi:hypothetical protein
MRRFGQLFIILLGVLIVHVPTASGCAGEVGMMVDDCPMTEMKVDDVPMPDDCPMGNMLAGQDRQDVPARSGDCSDCGRIADECCDVEPSPEPMSAHTLAGIQYGSTLALAELPVTPRVAPALQSPQHVPPDERHLSDLRRFTLLSALLL